ncbi:MAG: CCA tRNA nucleotidyltransferase [Campylobacterales bacterium]|nr:CCA tRNA nucleotidyltransferase [Campylobacterales bacterium]
MNLPKKINQNLQILKDLLSNHTNRAYFVGGSVRDYFLNQPTKDIDIEVFDISEEVFSKLMESIEAKGIGKSFFVYKWKNFDISLPRVESKVSTGHTGFAISLTNDIKLAASRRDFTVNSMMINIFTNELVDSYSGKEDLHNKILRVVNKDKFGEDSLRVLRGMQFSSRLGFSIESDTLKLCQTISLKDLSKERVFLEFEKIFQSDFLHFGIFYFHYLGIDKKIFKIKISKEELFTMMNDCKKAIALVSQNSKKYVFLYFLREVTKSDIRRILSVINTPKEYYSFFKEQPHLKTIKNYKSLVKLASLNPLEDWIGLYKSGYYDFAKKHGLLKDKFQIEITPRKLLAEGFRGKELGLELENRIDKEIDRWINGHC